MELYILRHGLAGQHKSSDPEVDRLRPLTPAGRKKMRRIGAVMRAMDLSIDLILSSPYTRAIQTADLVARELKLRKVLKFCEPLGAEGDPRELIKELVRRAPKSVMVVGHEPYLSRLASVLLSGGTGVSLTLKKGGLC